MLATVRIAMTNSSPLRQPRPAPHAPEQQLLGRFSDELTIHVVAIAALESDIQTEETGSALGCLRLR